MPRGIEAMAKTQLAPFPRAREDWQRARASSPEFAPALLACLSLSNSKLRRSFLSFFPRLPSTVFFGSGGAAVVELVNFRVLRADALSAHRWMDGGWMQCQTVAKVTFLS